MSAATLQSRRDAFDGWQRAHSFVGFPIAVFGKYSDDRAGYLAAGVTYYAFLAVFPMLLVLVSVLGFVLRGRPHLQNSILNTALGQFPVVGPQLHAHKLNGSGIALAVGLVAALWAGMRACQALQNAVDELWGIPIARRAGFLQAHARALLILLALGLGVIAISALGGLATAGTHLGIAWKVLSVALSAVLYFGLFWVVFRTLTSSERSWRNLRGGAIAAAVGYTILQVGGAYYVNHVVKSASNTYGTFALVIGLLAWIYLAIHVMLLATEVNVVATLHLWPRSLASTSPNPSVAPDEGAGPHKRLIEESATDRDPDVAIKASDRPHNG